MKKRLLSWLLVLTMVFSLIPSTMITSLAVEITTPKEIKFEENDDVYTISEDGQYILTGEYTDKVIKIIDDVSATLILNNATISSKTSPVQVTGAAKLTLVPKADTQNKLQCTTATAEDVETNSAANFTAGISVPKGATLVIATDDNGEGSLDVIGGYGGAGIGGSYTGNRSETDRASSGNQGDYGFAYQGINDAAGVGGAGGLGGLNGLAGEDAGTITIEGGVLNIVGGTDGVGIGGGKGTDGGNGENGLPGVQAASYYRDTTFIGLPARTSISGSGGGGAGGNGGTGGIGGQGGNVTIAGGTVNITGTGNAVAIGGGSGGTGGIGGQGGEGGEEKKCEESTMYQPTNGVRPGGGGAGGKGHIGYGGQGGQGGDSGSLTISGGVINATGLKSYGGGVVGIKGAEDFSSEEVLDADGKKVTEGKLGEEYEVNAYTVHNYAYGSTAVNSEAEHYAYVTHWNSKVGNYYFHVGRATTGGNGGERGAEVPAKSAGADGSLTIIGSGEKSSLWTGFFLKDENKLTTTATPKDEYGNLLYHYSLTVNELDNTTPVAGAQVTLSNVKGALGDTYTYTAVSNKEGKVELWLPIATDYRLAGKDVYSETEGWIPNAKPLTFDITARNNGAGSVVVGPDFTLTSSVTSKVYFSEDSENPVTLKVDASSINHTIHSVKWFVEPYAGTVNTYGPQAEKDTDVKAFDEGYRAASDANKKIINVTGQEHTFEIPIHENGRYWVQVSYNTGDSTGVTSTLGTAVEPLVVTNIYRKFPIQVNSYLLEKGVKVAESDYQSLKTGADVEYTAPYGFAWDLGGYDKSKLDGTKLLPGDVSAYDTVPLTPRTTWATWYNANILGNSESFILNVDDNDKRVSGYKPITMTLDAAFLAANTNPRADSFKPDGSVVDDASGSGTKDFSKYTIVYSPRDGALSAVEVMGVVSGEDGAETVLYSNPRSYTEAVASDTMIAQVLKGYKLTGAKIIYIEGNESNVSLVEQEDGSWGVTVVNIHGTKDKQLKDKISKVVFTYEDNMTNVTVNAVLNDDKRDTDTPNKVSASYKESLEIGKEHTFTAPEVPGYDCVGSSRGDDYKIASVAKDDSITFYYEKAQGNISYKAVDGDGNVLWTDSGTAAKGTTPEEKTPDKGVANYERDTAVATKYTITGTDTEYPNPDGKYNGLDEITVTYTYKHKTRKVVVEKYDITNTRTPLETGDPTTYNVGGYEEIQSGDAPAGYKIVGDSSRIVKITEGTEDLVVKFYYEASDEATVTVRLYASVADRDSDTDGSKAFQTITLPAGYGYPTSVKAPTIIGWVLKTGLTAGDDNHDDNPAEVSVTPIKGEAAPVVKFVYDADTETITVKAVEKNAALGNPELDTFTYEVQKGQGLSVKAPSVKGYKLSDTDLGDQTQSGSWNPTAEDLKNTKEYTFYYSKIGAEDLVKVIVYGVSDTNPKDNALYKYEKLFPVGSDAQKIAAFAQPRKAVESVTVDGTTSALDQATKEVTVDLTGKQANDTIEVVFTYKSNMATVTINAKDNTDAHNPLPAGVFTPKTVEAEIGYPFTYTAPAIPNYVNVGTSAQNGITVSADGNNVIDFYYEAAPVTGNVTYVAVDGEGNTLAYGAVKKLNKDEEVKADISSIDNYFPAGVTNWTVNTGVEPTITDANGQTVTKYDGKTDITVKFTFQRKTKEIGFKLIDADTGNEINANGKNLKTLAQMGIVTDLTEKVPDLTDLGYTKVDGQVLTVTAADNTTEQTVTVFYRKADNTASVDVKLYYTDPDTNSKVFIGSYTVSGVKETSRDIAAPDLTGQGYSNPDRAQKPVTFGTTNSIEFVYAYVANKVVTVKLWDVTDGTEDTQKKEISTATIANFKTSYRVLKDQTLTVNAPSIYGYVLAEDQDQVITKAYDNIADSNEVININYRAVDVDFVQINVTGQVDGGKTLYTYTDTVPVKAGQKEIQVYSWPGYKVKDDQASVEGADVPIAVANGKATVTFDKSAKTVNVTVTYIENTADVTIRAFWYKDGKTTTEKLDGFNDITVKAEVGTEFTYPAPSIPGYELKETSQQITVASEGNEYNLYYAKSSGNVTYIAMYNDQQVGSYSETLFKDSTVDTSFDKAPKVENYRVDQNTAAVVKGDASGKYNGKDDVTVTYQYTKAEKTVTIVLMDDATHTQIGTIKSDPYPTGEKATIAAPTEAVIDGTNVLEHYHLVTNGTLDRYVLDNDEEQFVYYYYEQTDAPVITVKLLDGEKVINAYTVKGEWGVETEIAAPNLTEQGYNYTGTDSDTRTVTPAKGTNESPVVELHYTAVTFDITVEITPEAAKTALGNTYTFTKAVKKGDAYSVTAPSIPGYTLEGALIQTIDKVEQAQTLIFKYAKTDDVSYVKHTIIGKIDDANGTREVFNYTASVSKSETADTKTPYYAPIQEGYNVDHTMVELPNNENGTVTFIYTANGASITIQHMNSNGSAKLDSVADVTMTGYKLNQTGETTVTVVAPAVSGYVLVGNATKNVTLQAGENTVSFNYKKMETQKVNFILTDKDTNAEIRTVEGVNGTTYTKDTFAADMAALGYSFVEGDAAFNAANGSIAVTETSNSNYTLYYERATRAVQYKYLDNEDKAIENVVDNSGNADTARVLEKFEAVAPTIPGYTVTGSLRQVINSVENNGEVLTVIFHYVKKSTGTVTVEHKVADEAPFKSYTVSVSDGEWFTATALSEAELAGKYIFAGTDRSQTVQAKNNADQTIEFLYTKNFVTVTASYVMDGQTYPYANGTVEVVKGKSAVVNPPAITGYELKGLKVGTAGSETELTYSGWDSSKNSLTLSNLDSDTQITYYYQPISQDLGKYQTTITVKDLYEVYTLDERTFTVAKENKEASYAPGTYDGYKLVQYKIDNGDAQEIPANNEYPKVNLNENHTITYIYQLADNTDNKVVVPGADGKLPSPDDVIIKPADGNKPSIDENGKVTLPDGGTITTPDGTIEVPGGTTVDKNGTITIPDNKGEGGGTVVDPSKPDGGVDKDTYYYVKYYANGGEGEAYTQLIKKGEQATLKSVAALGFTRSGFTATGWNTNEDGLGKSYNGGDQADANLTLFAQWKENEDRKHTYSATVTLHANTGANSQTEQQIITSDTTELISANLKANPFTLEGWTFMGWNTDKASNGGTYYADQKPVTLLHGGATTLYAQWIKYGEDGSITVPGSDNTPGSENDVTAKAGANGTLTRDAETGIITIPAGGSAVSKSGVISMPEGGTVKPDGTITVKNGSGSTEIKPGGDKKDDQVTTYTVTFNSGEAGAAPIVNLVKENDTVTPAKDIFTYEGHIFAYWTKDSGEKVPTGDPITITADLTLTAHWYVQKEDGSIVIPGDKGDIIVKPDGDKKPSVDKDGNVEIPGTGPVETPDGPIVVPGGSVVKPGDGDNTIVKPGTGSGDKDDTIYPKPTEPDQQPEGYITVIYKVGDVDGADQYKDVRHSDKGDSITVLGSQFDVPGKTFLYWTDEDGTRVDPNGTLKKDTVLTAQWKDIGSVVLTIKDGSNVQTMEVDGENEYVLIMRGSWTNKADDKNYIIPVLVDGNDATIGDLRWYVDAGSYTDEFQFSGKRLSGYDIVNVDAKTGQIEVLNSGIVRIVCESTQDASAQFTVILVVPGDVSKDGRVNMNDVDMLDEAVANDEEFTDVLVKLLADLNCDGKISMVDADYLAEIAIEDKEI